MENVKVIKVDTNAAQTSVKDLRNELKELRSTMLSTEQGTEEYNKALVRSAEIQHTLKEQMEEINASAMDFGQISSNLVKATGGLVAGFQAAQAAMNLFGIENEEVLKAMQKMQSLMAITQALPSIDSGIKAFKRLGLAIKGAALSMNGLKAALISTGIGAIVVAIGLLAANWDKVTEAMRKWGIVNEDTKKKLDEQKKKIDDLRTSYKKWQDEQAQSDRQDKINSLNAVAKKKYDELQASIDELADKEKDYRYKAQIAWEAEGKAAGDVWKAEADAIKTQSDLLKQRQKAILDNKNSYKELTKTTEEDVEEVVETIDELIARTTDWARSQMKEKDIVDAITKSLDEQIAHRKELQELKELEAEEEDTSFEDAFRQRIEGTINSLRQAFGTSEEEQYQQELDALQVALNTKLISEQEYYELRDALNKEYTQREIQRYVVAANSIGSIFTSLGDLMEEGSKEQKAMQIMGATINMLGGITAAIAGAFTTHSGPWDIALAAIQATAIAATGAATIAKMSKTNKNNAASSASSSPNTASISSIIAPVQYTQDVQGAAIEGAIKNTKVYVTETDITDTQNKVEVSENEAMF